MKKTIGPDRKAPVERSMQPLRAASVDLSGHRVSKVTREQRALPLPGDLLEAAGDVDSGFSI